MKILVLVLFFSYVSYAEEAKDQQGQHWRQENYPLDWKYHAGEYFIYDCERAHFACVDKEGDTNCRQERNFAMEKKLPQYPCAPLKKFESKKDCVHENYKVQDIGAHKRFCYPK